MELNVFLLRNMSSDPPSTPNRKNQLRDVGTIESIVTLEAQVAVR